MSISFIIYKYIEATNIQTRLSNAIEVFKYETSNDGQIINKNLTPIAEAGDTYAIYYLSFALYCGMNNLPRNIPRAKKILHKYDTSACNDVIFMIKNKNPDEEPECIGLMKQ